MVGSKKADRNDFKKNGPKDDRLRIKIPIDLYQRIKRMVKGKRMKISTILSRFFDLEDRFNILDPKFPDKYDRLLELGKKKAHEEASMFWIIVKYQGVCAKCKKTIKEGENALWGGQESGLLICRECAVEADSDKSLVKGHQKMLEKKRLSKAYDAEINEKAELYRDLTDKIWVLENEEAMKKLIQRAHVVLSNQDDIFQEWKDGYGKRAPQEEKDQIEKLLKANAETRDCFQAMKDHGRNVATLVEKPMAEKVKKKKEKKRYEV